MSSMKVLFGLGILLETLGLDVGFSRLLLTFLLQCVSFTRMDVDYGSDTVDSLTRESPSPRQTISVSG